MSRVTRFLTRETTAGVVDDPFDRQEHVRNQIRNYGRAREVKPK